MSELIQKNISLKAFNSWRVGGEAEFFAQPSSIEEIRQAINWVQSNVQPITLLGDGSNVLISDSGIKGLVLCLKKYKGIESTVVVDDRLQVTAKAGTSKMELMRAFLKNKLSPALFLAGLPGNLAGGIVMNAGVAEARSPREFCEIIDWIEVLKTDDSELCVKKYNKSEINWIYRSTSGWQPGVILRAQLSWPNEPIADIPKEVSAANKLRKSKQPLELPSCGSTFKNPEGTSAGRLIDECGLKGYRVGGAQISEKHANFIVNIENAMAEDIYKIINHVKKTVLDQKGINLLTEVKLIGEW